MTERFLQLSKSEIDYLRSVRPLPANVASAILASEVTEHGGCRVRVVGDLIHDLEELLELKLAEFGFDHEYRLNPEGELIDRIKAKVEREMLNS